MTQRPQCQEDGTVVHKGFAPNGKSEINKTTGKRWELWPCQCGKKIHRVVPGTPVRW